MTIFFAHNNNFYAFEPRLVIKKGELLKIFIYFFNLLQLLFFLLSSIFSRICLAMFEYFLIFEYAIFFNWLQSSTLVVKIMTINCKYLIFT